MNHVVLGPSGLKGKANRTLQLIKWFHINKKNAPNSFYWMAGHDERITLFGVLYVEG